MRVIFGSVIVSFIYRTVQLEHNLATGNGYTIGYEHSQTVGSRASEGVNFSEEVSQAFEGSILS